MNDDILIMNFTNKELEFLREQGYNVSNELDANVACDIVEELGVNDYGIIADIITKITTHPKW